MRSATEPLLVDDDRHREVFNRVGVGLRVLRQEVADEQREVFVELALRFRRERVEHDRRFPRARYAGEDRELALGNLERDVFEVVFARAADGDELGHFFERFGLADVLRATAWRTSALKADSSTVSPSWMSIARRTFPSRLELKSRPGSFRDAPLAKVNFTTFL